MKKEDKIEAVVAILDLPERVDKLEGSVGRLEKNVHRLGEDVHKLGENVGRLEKNLHRLEGSVGRLEKTVKASRATIATPNQGDAIGFASPLTLLEKGIALYQDSGAKEHVEKNKEDLLKHFEDIHEPYDIQEEAVLLMLQELRKDSDVKNFIFNNAEKTIKDVADVAGIALRDIVLKHKGIKIERVGAKGE